MSRGGPRTTGMVLPHNTSGLAGIGFKLYKGRTVHVWAACGDRRPARSVTSLGEHEALRQVIALRAEEGLPVPSLRKAVAALRAWMGDAR